LNVGSKGTFQSSLVCFKKVFTGDYQGMFWE
jgi:hypothetical protein